MSKFTDWELPCPICKETIRVPYQMEIICPDCGASLALDFYTDEEYEEYPILIENH